MTTQPEHEAIQRRVSRRTVLKAGAAVPIPGLVAGMPAITAAQTPASDMTIHIPVTGAQLPTENVTFNWSDSGDVKANFMRQFFAAYQEKHPNITINYQTAPFTDLKEILTIGFQNGNAPDAFQLPGSLPAALAISEEWIAPIDDIVPNFETWKAAFPEGSFFEGFNQFEGKTYSLPITKSSGYTTFTCYNTELASKAGVDPRNEPLTWDGLRSLCQRVTEQGGGNAFGIIFGADGGASYASFVGRLAAMEGLAGDINWLTGEFNYTTDAYLAALDLLLALKADGSIFPGSDSLKAPEARARFPQGNACIFLDGTYGPAQWMKDNPDFTFDVASQPIPNSGTYTPVGWNWGVTGANCFWVYANSKYQAIAGDLLHYLGTKEGNEAFLVLSGGGQPSIYPEVNDSAPIDERSKWMFKTLNDQQRLAPTPVVRNPDQATVLLEGKTLTPSLGDIMQGIMVGQIDDPKKALQDLTDRSMAERERAVKAAQDKGAEVSLDDWVFPNWDPTEDYTAEDYQALE